jgi:hypothetical protein
MAVRNDGSVRQLPVIDTERWLLAPRVGMEGLAMPHDDLSKHPHNPPHSTTGALDGNQ